MIVSMLHTAFTNLDLDVTRAASWLEVANNTHAICDWALETKASDDYIDMLRDLEDTALKGAAKLLGIEFGECVKVYHALYKQHDLFDF